MEIIIRALRDAAGPSKLHRRRAIEWLRYQSFEETCESAGFDPDLIEQHLRLIAAHEGVQAAYYARRAESDIVRHSLKGPKEIRLARLPAASMAMVNKLATG